MFLKILPFLFLALYVGSNTDAAANVVITSPSDGMTVSSPFELSATSQSSATPVSLLVYVNGGLVAQNSGQASISTSISLSAGTYTIQVQADYSRWWRDTSTSITVTVGGSSSGSSTSAAGQIVADMQGSNEGVPDGVPSNYDWAVGPVLGLGNNFAPQTALEWWGALFTGPGGNPASNTLVNVRNVSLYVLSQSTGIWTSYSFPFSQISSDTYSADFSVDYNNPVSMRLESDGSFSFSVAAGNVSHFYAPYPRVSVNPYDVAGIVALMDARLILNDPNGTDDRSIASYLLGAGTDPYPDTTGPGIENNESIGNGKLKYVQSDWRSFAMTTMTAAQIATNPPPVNFAGILP